MAYTPPSAPQNPDTVAQQMVADPRVQQAYGRYRTTRAQTDFNAYLETIRPYMNQIDQTHYGIDPETGLFRGTSNYGHWWEMGAGMAAGAAAPYGPWAGAAPSEASASANAPAALSKSIAGATSGAGGFPWGPVLKTAAPFVARPIANALTGNNGNPNSGTGSSMNLPPELSGLLNLQTQRIQQSQPLYDLMLRYATALMPNFAKQGAGGMPSPTPMGSPDMASIIQRMAVPR